MVFKSKKGIKRWPKNKEIKQKAKKPKSRGKAFGFLRPLPLKKTTYMTHFIIFWGFWWVISLDFRPKKRQKGVRFSVKFNDENLTDQKSPIRFVLKMCTPRGPLGCDIEIFSAQINSKSYENTDPYQSGIKKSHSILKTISSIL